MDGRVEDKLRKLAAVDARTAELAWLLYLSGDAEERREAEELFDVLLHDRAGKDYRRKVILDPPAPSICAGEYRLGDVVYPPGKAYSPFGLRESDWIRHVLIVGMTGTGKTNLAFHLLRELRRKAKPFLVFDWKRNYRDLLQLDEFRNLRVFTVGRDAAPFRFNPLVPPPGTRPGEWLMKLVDVLKHAYFVGEGVEYLMRRAIDETYQACAFYGDADPDVPTFQMVRHFLGKKRAQGRMMLWKASATRVVESLCFRHGLGPVLNAEQPAGFERLLEEPVVLELDSLSDSDKVFLTEALILWLYEYRKHEPERETFKHALLIEEGHHVLSREKEKRVGAETIMETCLRQIREFGEAVIVVDQEPSKLSNSIKANTYTKLVFNLGAGVDVRESAGDLGLARADVPFVNLLKTGEALVLVKGRVASPVQVRTPHVRIAKGEMGAGKPLAAKNL